MVSTDRSRGLEALRSDLWLPGRRESSLPPVTAWETQILRKDSSKWHKSTASHSGRGVGKLYCCQSPDRGQLWFLLWERFCFSFMISKCCVGQSIRKPEVMWRGECSDECFSQSRTDIIDNLQIKQTTSVWKWHLKLLKGDDMLGPSCFTWWNWIFGAVGLLKLYCDLCVVFSHFVSTFY